MSYLEDTIDWQAVHAIDEWLDRDVSQLYRDQPLAQDWARLSKVVEKLGEAISTLIGMTGQNPRKGFTHSDDDVTSEMADVVLTGILCIQHMTKNTSDTRQIIREKVRKLESRVTTNT